MLRGCVKDESETKMRKLERDDGLKGKRSSEIERKISRDEENSEESRPVTADRCGGEEILSG